MLTTTAKSSSSDSPAPQDPLASFQTNTTTRSQVMVPVKPEASVFLETETGDIVVVPAEDMAEFANEYRTWSFLMADFHAANAEIANLDAEIARLTATGQSDMQTKSALSQLEEKLDAAFTWQETAHGELQKQLKTLGSTKGSGKKLIELIPLLADNKVASGSAGPGKVDKSLKKVSYEKSAKGGVGINGKVYDLPEKLLYVRNDKYKAKWPKYKDADAPVKWTDVIAKDPKTGQRTIHKDKLKTAVHEKLKKAVKLQSKDLGELKFERVGGLTDWADAWNKSGKGVASTSGKMKLGDITGDVDVSTEAQLMRYMMGGSLNATFEPFKKGVSVKAEGSAECALAEAKAKAELHMPSKDGWMWTYHDVDGKPCDLGAIKCILSVELSGVIGASIAGELSMSIEHKDIQGKLPRMKGHRISRKARRAARGNTPVNQVTEEVKEEGVAADIEVFAGIKGGAEFKGMVQWRNPEDKEKKFKDLASICLLPEAQAGIGAGLNATVRYLPASGTFQIIAKASLCLGVGAEGKFGAEVSIATIQEFVKWVFYQVYHVDFAKLMLLSVEAFNAVVRLQFYVIASGIDVATGGIVPDLVIQKSVDTFLTKLESKASGAVARRALAKKISAEPEGLKTALPETKGQLLFTLTRFNMFDGVATGLGQQYLADQKRAVLTILKWSHTKRDLNNVLQHMTADGTKIDSELAKAKLKTFLESEGPSGLNIPGINATWDEDFDKFYQQLHASLMDEPVRGYGVARSDSPAYAVLKDSQDHALFASSGPNAFYV